MSIDKKIVSLNRAAPGAGSPERPARTTTSEKTVPIQILIVDDEPRNLVVLETVLDDPDYRLVRAHSADEALLALVAQEFALLILDIQMPGMTGFELADVIKKRKKTSQVPIIFLTAYYSEDQHVLEGYGSGAVDYLHKPVHPQILRSKVAVFAELHRKSRDVAIINAALFDEVKERRSAEEQLRQLNETLEQRVNERTEELRQANRMKDEFLAMLRTQLAHLNLLDRITRAIADRQDFGSISHVVLRNLEDHLPVHFGCICLYDRARQALTVSQVGAKSRVLAAQLAMTEQSVIDIDGNGLARCVEGELIYEPDVSKVDFKFPQRLARVGLRAFVAAPILVEGQVFGVMIMARCDAGNFESPDCEFLRQLSLHVGLAAHQAHLYTALQHAYDDLRQTHKAILQQERLRVVGQMASGIAHDINNALSPAALYAQSLLEGAEPLSERSRESLKIIGRAIDDVSKSVTRLREFYRPHELAVAPITVNRILEEVLKLTQARWQDMPQERGIVIRPQLERNSELPTIIASESELRDALTNLVLNAIDAMPNGGTLTLRSARDTASASPGAVIIEVCDTGIGMDELTRSRCLEPFFTTKGERGTGLGLSMVCGMVQRHGGDIIIESAADQGTRVRLIFPAGTTQLPASPDTAIQPRVVQALRLLLVEDDPLLRETLVNILTEDGHEVIAADGGQAGIDAFVDAHDRDHPIHAVITDLGMPHVDGSKVAASIKERSPGTPVILLTGWGHRLLSDNDIPENVDRVLGKPPKLNELRDALASLMTAANPLPMAL